MDQANVCPQCGMEISTIANANLPEERMCPICSPPSVRDLSTRLARKMRMAKQSAATAKLYEIWGDEEAAHSHETEAIQMTAEAQMIARSIQEPSVVVGEVANNKQNYVQDTLKKPDIAALDASAERIRLVLLHGNDCAALALDASNSIKAENSLEKMLAHQMAATHKAAMEMMSRAMYDLDAAQRIKMMNASMRAMETFQKAMLTLQRLRTNGQQNIVVQHVQVADGGQAVIAGAVAGGGSKK